MLRLGSKRRGTLPGAMLESPLPGDAFSVGEGRLESRLRRGLGPSGLAANRANLERFLDYCNDQGLIERSITVDDMFDGTACNT